MPSEPKDFSVRFSFANLAGAMASAFSRFAFFAVRQD